MSLEALREHLRRGPPTALYPGVWLLEQLDEESVPAPAAAPVEQVRSWRERLWSCDPSTRLGVAELAEALDHPVSWVYRRTATITPKERERAEKRKTRVPARLPHRRIDGALQFVAGEIRAWISQHEETIVAAPRNMRAPR